MPGMAGPVGPRFNSFYCALPASSAGIALLAPWFSSCAIIASDHHLLGASSPDFCCCTQKCTGPLLTTTATILRTFSGTPGVSRYQKWTDLNLPRHQCPCSKTVWVIRTRSDERQCHVNPHCYRWHAQYQSSLFSVYCKSHIFLFSQSSQQPQLPASSFLCSTSRIITLILTAFLLSPIVLFL